MIIGFQFIKCGWCHRNTVRYVLAYNWWRCHSCGAVNK